MWIPRPLDGGWTPDQARVAGHFPKARRVCVTAANGVGKTHLAADLAATFLIDQPGSMVLTTAPTQRQVEELLWPKIWKRLLHAGLADLGHPATRWEGPEGRFAFGFATDRPERMQGFHADKLLFIIDEASGLTADLLEAIEGICVGDDNFVFAIGNPNEPKGAFWQMANSPAWVQERLSALTHPNVVQRREVIPGATTWTALFSHLMDWCRILSEPTPETFTLELTDEEARRCRGEQAHDPLSPCHFLPNDAFRVRFLGLFPRAASDALINPDHLAAAVRRAASPHGRVLAALDIARTGGDRTVYAVRRGDTVTVLQIIDPAPLTEQAEAVHRLLLRDSPECLTCDAAGLGIGLIDFLRRINTTPTAIREFHGASEPVGPLSAKRYLNRRAQAYGHLSEVLQRESVSLPNDSELLEELAAITYSHTPDGRLVIVSKDELKGRGRRSPDLADAVAMLWEQASLFAPTMPAVRREEALEW